MANRLQKLLWSVLCGTALGLGAAGCYDSDSQDQDMYGPPPDTATDADDDAEDVVEDEESEVIGAYGPAPMYGPEPSP
jgi:hypothetical protein